MKKILFVLALFLGVSVSIQAEVLTGNCGAEGTDGDNLQYTFNTGTGVLVITGSGAMKDYDDDSPVWYDVECSSVQLPEGLTTIGTYAFYKCQCTQSLILPGSVTKLGRGAFYNSRFSAISLPEGLVEIDSWALADLKASSITIPSTVSTIGEKAFIYSYNSITSLTVDGHNTVYDSRNGCNAVIETATNKLIAACSATVIPASVTVIGGNAFYSGRMETLEIPEGVTTLEEECFGGCGYLRRVSIPSSVTEIGPSAFIRMGKYVASGTAKDIYVHWDTPLEVNARYVFYEGFNFTLHVPCGTESLYGAANVWKDFAAIEEMGRYTLTLGVNDETLGTATLLERTCNDVTIRAERTGHARFRYWSDGNTNAERTLSLSGDSTITAVFEKLDLTCEDVHQELSVEAVGSYTWNGITYTESGDYTQSFVMDSECDSIVTLHLAILLGGNCGASPNEESLQWQLNTATGALVITGTGIMENYYNNTPAPWSNYKDIITTVSLPEGMTAIGSYAFYKCSGLTSIVLPQSLEKIGGVAFYETALTSIVLPDNVTTIGYQAFAITKVEHITFPSGACDLGYGTFQNTKIKELVLPSTVSISASYAFSGCDSLVSVTLPDDMEELPSGIFNYCNNLETIVLPPSLKRINSYAFCNCWKLKVPVLPEGLELIDKEAFRSCQGEVPSISIPSSIDSIGYRAFYNCNINSGNTMFVGDIYVYAQTPITKIDSTAFEGLYGSTLHVPCGMKNAYESALVWKKFSEIVIPSSDYVLTLQVNDEERGKAEIEEQMCSTFVIKAQRLGHNVFTHWSDGSTEAKRTITLTGDSTLTAYFEPVQLDCEDVRDSIYVESVGSYEWNEHTYTSSGDYEQFFLLPTGCDSIVKMHLVVMPGGNCGAEGDNLKWAFNNETGKLMITGVGKMANYDYLSERAPWYPYCSEISLIEMPEGMTSIGDVAFYGLNNVSDVKIPNTVTSIGRWAFGACSKLEHITLPSGLTTLDAYVFSGCRELELTIPEGITAIGDEALASCVKIEELILPSTLTYIGVCAFHNMYKCTVVDIPVSVNYIGEKAFEMMSDIKTIYLHWDTPLEVPSDIFSNVDVSAITLHVPCGTKTAYEAAAVWGDFGEIVDDLSPFVLVCNVNDAELGKVEVLDETCTTRTVKAVRTGRGARFVQWDDGETDNPRTLQVESDTTITAIFERVDCDVKTEEISVEAINQYILNDVIYNTSGTYEQTIETVWGCDSIITLHLTVNPGGYCGAEGINGENLQWMFRTTTGELVITGEGKMASYQNNTYLSINTTPWYPYRDEIKSIILPEGLTLIGSRAFDNLDSIVELEIPETVRTIKYSAFSNCDSLAKVTLPSRLDTISQSIFLLSKALKEVVMPEYVEVIERQAFSYCYSLKNIVLPHSLKIISDYAFAVSGITDITIPNSVDSIGAAAFAAYNMTDVYVSWETPISIDYLAFDGVEVNVTLHVPCGTKEAYETIDEWRNFKSIEETELIVTILSNDDSWGYGSVVMHNCNTATITALPEEGYKFVQWSDDNTDNPRTLALTQDLTLTAEFECVPKAGEFSVEAEGSYVWNAETYTESGDYQQTFPMANGCDSTMTLHLTITGPQVEYEVAYVCDFTTQAASNNNQYATTWVYDNNWTVFGGSTNRAAWTYCKFGGKSSTLASANPVYLANISPFAKDIKQVKVYVNKAPVAGTMTVNEWGVDTYNAAAYSESTLLGVVYGSEITGPDTITIAVSPEAAYLWEAGVYFRVYWDLDNTTTTNGIIWIDKVEFLAEKALPTGPEPAAGQDGARSPRKVLRDGHVYIVLPDGRQYNVLGVRTNSY